MSNNKAPGPSHKSQDALKAMICEETKFQSSGENDDDGAKYIVEYFHNVLISFWDGDISINKWYIGNLAQVPKKGDLSNPNKLRPVCLFKSTYKVLASIIAKRTNPIIQDNRLEEQCGFLLEKRCTDALFELKAALQMQKEHGQTTQALFVDLIKAFDTVNHKFLWENGSQNKSIALNLKDFLIYKRELHVEDLEDRGVHPPGCPTAIRMPHVL
eukprot:12959312-Ditylum_brightwellii.AAC.1